MDFEALSIALKRSKKKVQQRATVVYVSRLFATVQLVGSVKLIDVGVDPNNLPNVGDMVIIQRPNEKDDWIITSTYSQPREGMSPYMLTNQMELIGSVSLEDNADFIYFTFSKVYTYIQLNMALRSLAAASSDGVNVIFNEDTTLANYQSANLTASTATWTYQAQNSTIGAAFIRYGASGNTSTANVFAPSVINVIDIPGQYKVWSGQAMNPINHPSNPLLTVLTNGYYKSSSPISSIKIMSNTAATQLAVGSTVFVFAM